jgi:Lon protease-like protein
MTGRGFEPGTVIEELAVFPLPQCVLFPGTVLPLHIFEPRYRKMATDVLATSRQLSVAFVADPRRVDERGHPQLALTSGIGEVVRHQERSDGRHNIVLLGRARVQLEELPFRPPYRRARATVLGSDGARVPDSDIAALVSIATRFAGRVRSHGRLDFNLPPTYEPGLLADACASALVIEASERQHVLETLDVAKRVRLASELLAVQEALLARGVAVH